MRSRVSSSAKGVALLLIAALSHAHCSGASVDQLILQNLRPLQSLEFTAGVETRQPNGHWKQTGLERYRVDFRNGSFRKDTLAIQTPTSGVVASLAWSGSTIKTIQFAVGETTDVDFDALVPSTASGAITTGRPYKFNPFFLFYRGDGTQDSLFQILQSKTDTDWKSINESVEENRARVELASGEIVIFNAETGAPVSRTSMAVSNDDRDYERMQIKVLQTFPLMGWIFPSLMEWTERNTNGEVEFVKRFSIDPKRFFPDKRLSPSDLEITFPVGCLVRDNILGKSYQNKSAEGLNETEENIINRLERVLDTAEQQ